MAYLAGDQVRAGGDGVKRCTTHHLLTNGGKTGHPPDLLQDDCRKLSKWLASRMNARQEVREVCKLIAQEKTMNDKTAQTVMDELRLAKRAITMAGLNGWGNLFSDAADTIDNLRAQLAEAQRDAERLDWIIEHRAYVVSDPDCCDGYWLNYARPDGTMWTQATEHETPRAAIDAAKGPA